MAKEALLRIGKPLLIVAAMLPLAALIYAALNNGLGTDPVKALIVETGEWALWLLLACFAVSPLRSWFGAAWLLRFRRTLGLLAFFYIMLHLLIWLVLDVQILSQAWADIVKRPFVTLGMAGFLLLVPLAVTSTRG